MTDWMNEVTYQLRSLLGEATTVSGQPVGRFAVRETSGDLTVCIETRRVHRLRPYAVDHMPSGITVIAFDDRGQALAVADDIALHAAEDVDGTTFEELKRQCGPEIDAWLTMIDALRQHVPFRKWRAQRDGQRAEVDTCR